MYYCLNEDWLLRGWDLLPTGIVRWKSENVIFVQPALYRKIRDCAWMVFEESPFLTEDERKALDQMVKLNIMGLHDHVVPLTERQQYLKYPNRYLHAVHWAVTGKCNCRCKHCYMSAPTGKIPEYSHEKCLEIIDQMEGAGIRSVALTGGEALVRRDFLDLAQHLSDAGIRISTIMSNGLLVTEELLTALEEMGQKPEFNMSFDGIGTHDWLRGVPGVEKAVTRAFALCRDRGFPTGSEYCLHKGNLHQLRDSVKLLADLGCGSLKVNGLSAEGEALAIQEYCLSQDELFQAFLDYIPQYVEDGEPLAIMLSGMFHSDGHGHRGVPFSKGLEKNECDDYCLCGHARNMMHITADGYIVPCIPIGSIECGRTHFPNIENITFREALTDSTYMSFIDTRLRTYFEHHPECAACEFRNRCAGGCRGIAAESGDLMGRDMQTCAFFRQGWYDKTLALMKELNISPDA